MKVKVGLSKDTVKKFFAGNIEKIMLVVVALLFLMFLLKAISPGTLDSKFRPEALKGKTQDALRTISTNTHTPLQLPAYDAQSLTKPLDEASSSHSTIWSPLVFQEKTKRPDPHLFSVEDLVVETGYGPFALNSPDAMGGQQVFGAPVRPSPGNEGMARPSVRGGPGSEGMAPRLAPARGGPGSEGLAPRLQTARGRRAADEDAATAIADDVPHVATVIGGIQAIPGSAAVEGRRWAVITGLVPVAKQIEEYHKKFSNALPNPLAQMGHQLDVPTYFWFLVERAEVTSAAPDEQPKWVKLDTLKAMPTREPTTWAGTAPELVDPGYTDPAFTCLLGPLMLRDWDKRVVHPKIPILPPIDPLGHQLAPAAMPVIAEAQLGPNGLPLPEVAQAPVEIMPADQVVTHKLFRYFDYAVEPGKKYVYRVRLALKNPNQNVPVAVLENPESTKQPYAFSDWSQPSPVVTIPSDHRVLISEVKTAKNSDEQMLKVWCVGWNHNEAKEVAMEFDLARGEVANFTKENAPVINPLTHQVETQKFIFLSNQMLVDLWQSNGPTGAASVDALLSDPKGQLAIRSKAADKVEVDHYVKLSQAMQPVNPNAVLGAPPLQAPPLGAPGVVPKPAAGGVKPRQPAKVAGGDG